MVAKAAVLQKENGFSDEAFGMTRTLVDIFITLPYIASSDTEELACRFTHPKLSPIARERANAFGGAAALRYECQRHNLLKLQALRLWPNV